jgi:Dolichyl-phosphate-mannose-protein mannosyltransferase
MACDRRTRAPDAGERVSTGAQGATPSGWRGPAVRPRWALGLVLLVAGLLMSQRLADPSLNYPDSAQVRMDGVFILDALRSLPHFRLDQFAAAYYAQYPALSLGYRPPFFPLVEALFNSVFGINVWSSRLALLAFAAAGLIAWFALVRRLFDPATAFWASLLLATTPFVVQWGWYTMSDLPVLSLMLVMAYFFHRSSESSAPRYVYATILVFVLCVWTKPTAMYLSLWLVLCLVARGGLRAYLTRRAVWGAAVLALVALAPLAMLTLTLGTYNIAQSVGSPRGAPWWWRLHWHNLTAYVATLVTDHLVLPVVVLSLAGIGLALLKRDARLRDWGLLIGTTYVFFTALLAKDSRYTIFWIPAFVLFAALPAYYLRRSPGYPATVVLLAVTALYQLAQVAASRPQYATGYDVAAAYVMQHRESPMIFFDGVNNGSFVYFIRTLDPDRSTFVLRGDKLLTSSVQEKGKRLMVHAHTVHDIQALFDRYGVVHIVVERDERSNIAIHHELRRFLNTGRFQLVQEIPVESNQALLQGQTLRIYRYLHPKSIAADRLDIPVPLIGRTITAPLPRPPGE